MIIKIWDCLVIGKKFISFVCSSDGILALSRNFNETYVISHFFSTIKQSVNGEAIVQILLCRLKTVIFS